MRAFTETKEQDVPMKYRIENLGGTGVRKGDYFRSNTSGITHGKYFLKISEPLDFEPLNKEFYNFNNKNINKNINNVLELLEKIDNGQMYRISFSPNFDNNSIYDVEINRILKSFEIGVLESKFKEYEYNFKDMYLFNLKIIFTGLDKKKLNELKDSLKSKEIDLNTLKNIINKYNLSLNVNGINNHCYFSKTRTNFEGRDNKLLDIMTFKKASE